jgi:hypothetical protein
MKHGDRTGNDKSPEQGRLSTTRPKDREELAPTPPEHFEFIVPLKRTANPPHGLRWKGFTG